LSKAGIGIGIDSSFPHFQFNIIFRICSHNEIRKFHYHLNANATSLFYLFGLLICKIRSFKNIVSASGLSFGYLNKERLLI
jgi:hypothetical protein